MLSGNVVGYTIKVTVWVGIRKVVRETAARPVQKVVSVVVQVKSLIPLQGAIYYGELAYRQTRHREK